MHWSFGRRLPGFDATPPTATLVTPPDGASYPQNAVVNADYSCADESGGSGLVSCVGTVPNGSPIDTSRRLRTRSR